MFLTAAGYPESLVLPSKNQSRCYEILSIDHHCYAKSQLFLERYRLVKLIKEIMANPKYDLSPNSAEVDNLVTAYLIKHEEEQLSHAVIFAGEGDVPPNPRLRHVSQAEVRGIFAAHSAWLLGFHLNLGQARCPLDVRAWCEFIGKVRIAKAAPASGDWGSTYDDDNIWDEDTGETPHAIAKTLAIFGGTVEGWERKLENAITKHPAGLFDDETSSASPTLNKIEYVWDSDYSECSTPGCSDSESDFDAPPFKPSPLLSRILQHILRPPALLPGRGIWDCPVPKCTHSINFFHLNERDVAQLTPRYVASYVRNKQYETLGDETVRMALCQMVSRHYISHLRRIQPDLAAAEKEFVSQILETVRYPDA
ncbi:hypothetical protein B0H10DRAFT_1215987 [Mycena sp. CBHHK59/15]|nr:hypothetical protein B0H10DRAFT_1215987 [Mycena sp. CBHHK59/15]